jgi:DNA (cytosine-5)-methyltransferase 1
LAHALRVNVKGVKPGIVDPQEWAGPIIGSLGPCRDGFGQWAVEPNVGRVANGVPDRAHRLKALGNAIVPQIAELLGHAILQSERRAA